MRWWSELKYLVKKLNRRRAERELQEEIGAHLEMETQEKIADGFSREKARYAAQRAFGSVALATEDSRAWWGFRVLEELWQDLHYGARMLVKQPGFTLVVVVTLALGIGANTAVFSVINAVLLRPLPYRNADGLVMVWGNLLALGMKRMGARVAEYDNYRRQLQIFSETAAFNNLSFNLSEAGGDPERIAGATVTASLFPMLGAGVAAGRLFTTDNEQVGSDQVVIISHGLWQRRFGSDPNLVGKTIALDGQNRTVVGILPAGFQFPHKSFPFAEPADLFVPLAFTSEQIAQRSGRFEYKVLARLRHGVTLDQAQGQNETMARTYWPPGKENAQNPN